MLKHLSISNYAIISDLSLDLGNGFSIITGETGAGKSIILGALSLLMGARADVSVLKDKQSKCILEAQFDVDAYGLQSLFELYDLDWDSICVIRREITPKGKSRAFVNDSPVSLKVLKEVSGRLIDIHAQNEALKMNESDFQYEVLDSSLADTCLLANYKSCYNQWRKITLDLKEKETALEKACADFDYYQFQVDQLSEASLKDGEQEELEQKRDSMENAEAIHSALYQTANGLSMDDVGITSRIKEIYHLISKVEDHSPEVKELSSRIENALYELRDIANESESLTTSFIFNPVELEDINQRLDLIYTLEQKHRVNSVAELLDIEYNFSQKIGSVSDLEESIASLKSDLELKLVELTHLASCLTDSRMGIVEAVEIYVHDILQDLGMPNAQFKVKIDIQDGFNQWGQNNIEFLLSANKNQLLEPVNKVASGGEISRLMLALKSLLAQKKALPTLIFDEIDTGISGDIARKMGLLLRKMGTCMQVINITHLPQVASLGDHHFFVYKSDSKTETNSHIRELNYDERIVEIAKMLSGEVVTEAALNNAKELLIVS
ncbi:DNA repair protein RecN [Halosquirtibacter laminarini]|uniref:DNA repair protein RecN n=1 Tax=Halosquirtibacter laminarini TaxID=3374600 RepID=A0AC61NDV7_9BACT|nr:DNA repair protein RecN [Prolixibacteraceae bacterium]